MATIKPAVETSDFVGVFTDTLPVFLLAVSGILIVTIVYIIKMVKKYRTAGKAVEQKLAMLEKDMEETKQRLDQMEKGSNKDE